MFSLTYSPPCRVPSEPVRWRDERQGGPVFDGIALTYLDILRTRLPSAMMFSLF